MTVEPTRVFCQNCRSANSINDELCHACGTRLLIYAPYRNSEAAPPFPSEYESHLLRRIRTLEQRISEMSEVIDLTTDVLRGRNADLAESRAAVKKGATEAINEEIALPEPETVIEIDVAAIAAAHEGPNSAIFSELLRQAAGLLDAGEEREALRMYERCLLLSPGNLLLYRDVGLLCFARERFSDALRIFSKLAAMLPANQGLRMMRAALAAQNGDLDSARRFFENSVEPSASEVSAGGRLISALIDVASGRPDFAEQNLTEASRGLGESPEICYLIAAIRFDLGLTESASEAIGKTLALDAGFADALFLAAMIAEKQGTPERARELVAAAASSNLAGAQCGRFLVVGGDFPAKSLVFEHLTERRSGILSGLPRRLRRFTENILLDALRD